MKWWQEILPLQGVKTDEEQINKALDPEYTDKIMLIRNRKSRIYFLSFVPNLLKRHMLLVVYNLHKTIAESLARSLR